MKRNIILLLLIHVILTGCQANPEKQLNNGISAGSVIKLINKEKAVLIQDKIITGDLDFTKAGKAEVFSTSQKTARITVPVTFLNCIFMGKVSTVHSDGKITTTNRFGGSVTFEACDFRGEADFSNTIVEGSANFTGAIFRERALFNNVTLMGRHNYFTAFTSEKHFSMQESAIAGEADFFKARVTGKISFQGSVFSGTARFSDMDCDGKSDFSLTRFGSDALFTYANFGSDFRMGNAVVYGRLDLISVQFQSAAWLSNSSFYGAVNLTKSTASGNFDLSGCTFFKGEPIQDEFVVTSPGSLITDGSKIAVFNEFIRN